MTDKYLGENLIFVVSQPRSGSTLLQRVLSGHPSIQTSAETWLMLHPAYSLKAQGIETEYNAAWAAKGVEDFLQHYTSGRSVYLDAIREWANVLYGSALASSGKSLFLDKTPRYFFILDELVEIFPKARFVFLLRNPLAVLASEMKTYVKGNWDVIGLFKPDLVDAPRWILDGIRKMGASAIVVRYEDFVSDADEQTKKLCEKLGIAFHPEMVEYSRAPAPKGVMNDPIGVHQHTRPSTESVDKWKWMRDDLQARHFAQAYLKTLGRDVYEAFGYEFSAAEQFFGPDQIRPSVRSGIYPWNLAINSARTRTWREEVMAEWFRKTRSKQSFVLGTLAMLKRTVAKAIASLADNLSVRE